jgi:uncharacterized protein with HEPN domain
VKDDRVYLGHVLRCIERIEEYAGGDSARFSASNLVQDAVLRNLQTMAESTQRLSADLKARRPEIDWTALAGLRNVLVHSYLGVDLDQVQRAIEQDMPKLKSACIALMAELEKP